MFIILFLVFITVFTVWFLYEDYLWLIADEEDLAIDSKPKPRIKKGGNKMRFFKALTPDQLKEKLKKAEEAKKAEQERLRRKKVVTVYYTICTKFQGSSSFSFKTDRAFYPSPPELFNYIKIKADSYKTTTKFVTFFKGKEEVGVYNLNNIEGFKRETVVTYPLVHP